MKILLTVLLATVLVPEPADIPQAPTRAVSPAEPQSFEEIMTAASGQFRAGKYEAVLIILDKGGGLPHPEILNLRGAALVELGRGKEAVPFFEWALELEPTHFWARFNLAEIALLAGDLHGARKQFLGLPQRTPEETELVALKLLLVDLRLEDMASATRQLPDWPPATASGYAAYAAIAHAEGDSAKRSALFDEAKRVYPEQWSEFLQKTLKESGIPIN
jgi:tetratricopeptide (TPR) repeat protein